MLIDSSNVELLRTYRVNGKAGIWFAKVRATTLAYAGAHGIKAALRIEVNPALFPDGCSEEQVRKVKHALAAGICEAFGREGLGARVGYDRTPTDPGPYGPDFEVSGELEETELEFHEAFDRRLDSLVDTARRMLL